MDLSIIIVNWNSRAYLAKCLTSIYENTRGLEFEIIVVDNASFDGCGEMLAQRFPQVRFWQSQANLGFAGANNLGFRHSTGRALLFLNPDTELLGNAISVLFKTAEDFKDAGVIGAKLINTDGTVQTSCIQRFPTILNQALDAEALRNAFPRLGIWGIAPLLTKQQNPVAVEVISGACMMISRNSFEQVGRLTTEYFMYAEDVDLCFKAHRSGLVNYYVSEATVVHHGGASTTAREDNHFSAIMIRDSLATFFARNKSPIYAIAYRMTVALVSVSRCFVLITGLPFTSRSNNIRSALSRWVAVFHWAIGRNSPARGPSARRTI